MPFLLTLKHVTEMLKHVLTFLDVKNGSISVFAAFSKYIWERRIKHSYIVEATIEFTLNHCTTVTWVQPACKTPQLL